MIIFVVVMIVIALIAAAGFFIANKSETHPGVEQPKPTHSAITEPPLTEPVMGDEDVVTYLPADVPRILHEALSSVPMATVEEALMGCYGTMGAGGKQAVRPYQTDSLDELLVRVTAAISTMENEEHISKFTVSTHKKSKANPHVDLLAHSNTDPKRIRLVRFWRTQQGFVSNLPG